MRPIKDAAGEKEISEITIKDENEISACDFYNISFDGDGKSSLGSYADAIANLAGLTDLQVASMHPKDYVALSAEVGKYIS